MDVERSYQIVKSLAEGINPFTGEVLEAGHVCQHPEAIRALFHACADLERVAKRERRLQRARLTMPENTGKEWSHEEDRLLLARFKTGTSIDDMAAIHARTPTAITARLEKLGLTGPAALARNVTPLPLRG